MIKEMMMKYSGFGYICGCDEVVCLFVLVTDVWLNEYEYVCVLV